MFEHLKKYWIIIVAAPHRGGSTITATMIAKDTGHDLVLEDEFSYSNVMQFAMFLQCDYGPRVIQCPFLCHEIHDLEYLYGVDMSKILVIFVHRYRPHIIRSERAAKLKNGSKVDFERISFGQKAHYNSQTKQHISDLKYDAWNDQCKVIPNALDVGYESLRKNPLWVDSRDFSVRQTDPNIEPRLTPVMRPPPEQIVNAIEAIQDR